MGREPSGLHNYALVLSPEVEGAMRDGTPVVAFESAIISHGMPAPDNTALAHTLMRLCREEHVTPATIMVLHGKIIVGASEAQISELATLPDRRKIGMRELALAVSAGWSGGTTVSATAKIAALVGIRVFVTGGIGGVHRGGEASMDVSADLEVVSQERVAIICAGAKAILDIGRTLEYLETHSVPVVGYGCDALPLFFSRDSEYAVQHRCNTPEEIAALVTTGWALGVMRGIIIANPCPSEVEIPHGEIAGIIEQADGEARERGIAGQGVTPFLLQRINELTTGRSLRANWALVENNCRLGIGVAQALCSQAGKA